MKRAFSLIELLVSISLIAILISILLPSLAGARQAGRAARCLSNLRQLGFAWQMYAAAHDDRAMPLAYTSLADVGTGDSIYWWGSAGNISGHVDHAAGFIAPYLDASLAESSVFECPSQPWETYRPQGAAQTITSTYGYNGYYLSPSRTPGWSMSIGHRPWRRIADILQPCDLFVFADTLLPGRPPANNALLDPPMLFQGAGRWTVNRSPTTAFRHRSAAAAARADGSASLNPASPASLIDAENRIGSVGTANDPHYVPDWRDW